ncbi:MAG: hypothetical protein WC454_06085 [Phycisphaerae bacterium]|jgi:hypothetical protein
MKMQTNYKIILAKDFIRATPAGELDLEQSKIVISQLVEMANVAADYELLMDVREAHGSMNQNDLWELILELGKHRSAFRNKIAVLARDDEQFNKAVFLEMCASVSGFKISAFHDFEQATNWLQSSDGLEDLWK